MAVSVSEIIKAPKEKVWAMITDIDNADKNISAINEIKVLERPESGFIGLKWQETREMFGKEATETMWVEKAQEGEWYETTALNCGCEYKTKIQIEQIVDGVKLSMTFSAKPISLMAKLMSPVGLLFRGMIRKAFEKDLGDLKISLESTAE